MPETRSLISVTSPGFGATSAVNSGFARLTLADPEDRGRSQQEIAETLTVGVKRLTGARTFVSQSPTIAAGRRLGLPVQFVLQAPNMEELEAVLPAFLAAAEEHPTFSAVDVNLKFNKPELRVATERERARDLGVSTLDVARTLQLAFSEQRLGFFVRDGKQFEIIGQVARENRDETFDLNNLYVPTSRGAPVLLDKLVALSEESRPSQLFRFDRYVSATVSAGLASGRTIADGIAALEEVAGPLLDDSFSTALSGEARDFAESARSLDFVFLLVLVLIYLVLAAQFESFRAP